MIKYSKETISMESIESNMKSINLNENFRKVI